MSNRAPCGYEHEYEGYIFQCPFWADEEHAHAPKGCNPFVDYSDPEELEQ